MSGRISNVLAKWVVDQISTLCWDIAYLSTVTRGPRNRCLHGTVTREPCNIGACIVLWPLNLAIYVLAWYCDQWTLKYMCLHGTVNLAIYVLAWYCEPCNRCLHGTVTREPRNMCLHGTMTREPCNRCLHGTVTREPCNRCLHGTVTREPCNRCLHGTVTREPYNNCALLTLLSAAGSSRL